MFQRDAGAGLGARPSPITVHGPGCQLQAMVRNAAATAVIQSANPSLVELECSPAQLNHARLCTNYSEAQWWTESLPIRQAWRLQANRAGERRTGQARGHSAALQAALASATDAIAQGHATFVRYNVANKFQTVHDTLVEGAPDAEVLAAWFQVGPDRQAAAAALDAACASHPLLDAVHRARENVVHVLLCDGMATDVRGTVGPYSGDDLMGRNQDNANLTPLDLAQLLLPKWTIAHRAAKVRSIKRIVQLLQQASELRDAGLASLPPDLLQHVPAQVLHTGGTPTTPVQPSAHTHTDHTHRPSFIAALLSGLRAQQPLEVLRQTIGECQAAHVAGGWEKAMPQLCALAWAAADDTTDQPVLHAVHYARKDVVTYLLQAGFPAGKPGRVAARPGDDCTADELLHPLTPAELAEMLAAKQFVAGAREASGDMRSLARRLREVSEHESAPLTPSQPLQLGTQSPRDSVARSVHGSSPVQPASVSDGDLFSDDSDSSSTSSASALARTGAARKAAARETPMAPLAQLDVLARRLSQGRLAAAARGLDYALAFDLLLVRVLATDWDDAEAAQASRKHLRDLRSGRVLRSVRNIDSDAEYVQFSDEPNLPEADIDASGNGFNSDVFFSQSTQSSQLALTGQNTGQLRDFGRPAERTHTAKPVPATTQRGSFKAKRSAAKSAAVARRALANKVLEFSWSEHQPSEARSCLDHLDIEEDEWQTALEEPDTGAARNELIAEDSSSASADVFYLSLQAARLASSWARGHSHVYIGRTQLGVPAWTPSVDGDSSEMPLLHDQPSLQIGEPLPAVLPDPQSSALVHHADQVGMGPLPSSLTRTAAAPRGQPLAKHLASRLPQHRRPAHALAPAQRIALENESLAGLGRLEAARSARTGRLPTSTSDTTRKFARRQHANADDATQSTARAATGTSVQHCSRSRAVRHSVVFSGNSVNTGALSMALQASLPPALLHALKAATSSHATSYSAALERALHSGSGAASVGSVAGPADGGALFPADPAVNKIDEYQPARRGSILASIAAGLARQVYGDTGSGHAGADRTTVTQSVASASAGKLLANEPTAVLQTSKLLPQDRCGPAAQNDSGSDDVQHIYDAGRPTVSAKLSSSTADALHQNLANDQQAHGLDAPAQSALQRLHQGVRVMSQSAAQQNWLLLPPSWTDLAARQIGDLHAALPAATLDSPLAAHSLTSPEIVAHVKQSVWGLRSALSASVSWQWACSALGMQGGGWQPRIAQQLFAGQLSGIGERAVLELCARRSPAISGASAAWRLPKGLSGTGRLRRAASLAAVAARWQKLARAQQADCWQAANTLSSAMRAHAAEFGSAAARSMGAIDTWVRLANALLPAVCPDRAVHSHSKYRGGVNVGPKVLLSTWALVPFIGASSSGVAWLRIVVTLTDTVLHCAAAAMAALESSQDEFGAATRADVVQLVRDWQAALLQAGISLAQYAQPSVLVPACAACTGWGSQLWRQLAHAGTLEGAHGVAWLTSSLVQAFAQPASREHSSALVCVHPEEGVILNDDNLPVHGVWLGSVCAWLLHARALRPSLADAQVSTLETAHSALLVLLQAHPCVTTEHAPGFWRTALNAACEEAFGNVSAASLTPPAAAQYGVASQHAIQAVPHLHHTAMIEADWLNSWVSWRAVVGADLVQRAVLVTALRARASAAQPQGSSTWAHMQTGWMLSTVYVEPDLAQTDRPAVTASLALDYCMLLAGAVVCDGPSAWDWATTWALAAPSNPAGASRAFMHPTPRATVLASPTPLPSVAQMITCMAVEARPHHEVATLLATRQLAAAGTPRNGSRDSAHLCAIVGQQPGSTDVAAVTVALLLSGEAIRESHGESGSLTAGTAAQLAGRLYFTDSQSIGRAAALSAEVWPLLGALAQWKALGTPAARDLCRELAGNLASTTASGTASLQANLGAGVLALHVLAYAACASQATALRRIVKDLTRLQQAVASSGNSTCSTDLAVSCVYLLRNLHTHAGVPVAPQSAVAKFFIHQARAAIASACQTVHKATASYFDAARSLWTQLQPCEGGGEADVLAGRRVPVLFGSTAMDNITLQLSRAGAAHAATKHVRVANGRLPSVHATSGMDPLYVRQTLGHGAAQQALSSNGLRALHSAMPKLQQAAEAVHRALAEFALCHSAVARTAADIAALAPRGDTTTAAHVYNELQCDAAFTQALVCPAATVRAVQLAGALSALGADVDKLLDLASPQDVVAWCLQAHQACAAVSMTVQPLVLLQQGIARVLAAGQANSSSEQRAAAGSWLLALRCTAVPVGLSGAEAHESEAAACAFLASVQAQPELATGERRAGLAGSSDCTSSLFADLPSRESDSAHAAVSAGQANDDDDDSWFDVDVDALAAAVPNNGQPAIVSGPHSVPAPAASEHSPDAAALPAAVAAAIASALKPKSSPEAHRLFSALRAEVQDEFKLAGAPSAVRLALPVWNSMTPAAAACIPLLHWACATVDQGGAHLSEPATWLVQAEQWMLRPTAELAHTAHIAATGLWLCGQAQDWAEVWTCVSDGCSVLNTLAEPRANWYTGCWDPAIPTDSAPCLWWGAKPAAEQSTVTQLIVSPWDLPWHLLVWPAVAASRAAFMPEFKVQRAHEHLLSAVHGNLPIVHAAWCAAHLPAKYTLVAALFAQAEVSRRADKKSCQSAVSRAAVQGWVQHVQSSDAKASDWLSLVLTFCVSSACSGQLEQGLPGALLLANLARLLHSVEIDVILPTSACTGAGACSAKGQLRTLVHCEPEEPARALAALANASLTVRNPTLAQLCRPRVASVANMALTSIAGVAQLFGGADALEANLALQPARMRVCAWAITNRVMTLAAECRQLGLRAVQAHLLRAIASPLQLGVACAPAHSALHALWTELLAAVQQAQALD